MTACTRPFTVLIVLYLLLGITPSQARITQDVTQQRGEFLVAEKALKNGDHKAYQRAKRALKDYPLYPYLEYQELRQQLSGVAADQAQRFLVDHQDTPLATRFRRAFLYEQARRGRWQTFVEFYQPTSNIKLRCHFLNALIQTGRAEKAWQDTEPLWLGGRSRPDACDPVFDAWRAAGKLHSNLVWQRIDLAMAASQTRLAGYLGRFLEPREKPWLQRWLGVHQDPRSILNQDDFSTPHPYRQQILLHGLKRLARQDADSAWSAWRKLSASYPFDKTQRYQADRALALAALSDEHPEALERLERLSPEQSDTSLLETRLRAALSRQDWQRTLSWIEALPAELGASERWRYWRARSLESLGGEEEASGIYHELAAERSYHGFLAADRVGRDYNLEHTPLSVPGQRLARVASDPGLLRARELFYLQRLVDARREWRMATRDLDAPELMAAAKLAQGWGWHQQAIFTLARSRYWEDLELRFPVAHQTQVDQAAAKRELDNAWVFAVLRQESAFAADARSPAGAMGLMQLMPRTARTTARKLKRRAPRQADLLMPEINIELGTAYLRQVLEQLNDNPVLATAAYNAGPHRVSRWLPDESAPADLWIATIPFKETRRYTQRVLAYSVIYDLRLGKKPKRLKQRMPAVTPEPTASSVAATASGGDATPL